MVCGDSFPKWALARLKTSVCAACIAFINTGSYLSKVERTLNEIGGITSYRVNMIFASIYVYSGKNYRFFNWGVLFLILLFIELFRMILRAKSEA